MGSPNPATRRVLVIGCGRAGASMALTFARRGWSVSVSDRIAGKARALARRSRLSTRSAGPFGLVILAVPDPCITRTARALVRKGMPPALAVHLGGAPPVEALAPLERAGWRTGKMHPVLAFPSEPVPLPRGVAFGVAASQAGTLPAVERIVKGLAGVPIRIRRGRDTAWHLASVMAGNFLHAQLFAAGTLLERAAEIPRGEAARTLAPLVRSSLENALADGPRGLTGPVARGDAGTLEAHLAVLLQQHPEISIYYASATALLFRLLPPARRAALRRRLKRRGILI